MLNYVYAALQAQLQTKLVGEGYDPTVGIMHRTKPGSPTFVFDMMEPERPKVGRAVSGFVKANKFHPADFTIAADGVYRFNPEMVRRLVQLVTAMRAEIELRTIHRPTWYRSQNNRVCYRKSLSEDRDGAIERLPHAPKYGDANGKPR
jgi:CRISPR/Cas system-associated endonuclease Cas1